MSTIRATLTLSEITSLAISELSAPLEDKLSELKLYIDKLEGDLDSSLDARTIAFEKFLTNKYKHHIEYFNKSFDKQNVCLTFNVEDFPLEMNLEVNSLGTFGNLEFEYDLDDELSNTQEHQNLTTIEDEYNDVQINIKETREKLYTLKNKANKIKDKLACHVMTDNQEKDLFALAKNLLESN